MKYPGISLRRLIQWFGGGVFVVLMVVLIVTYWLIGEVAAVLCAAAAALSVLLAAVVTIVILQKKLSFFTAEICCSLEAMMNGVMPEGQMLTEEETLLSRIVHRLNQLYRMMKKQNERIDREREELQQLVSDISHQTRTPITNMKMINETLQQGNLSSVDVQEFLQALDTQIDKLDFLIAAMVKTSRLETGIFVLQKKSALLYDTLAAAVGGIFSKARQKQMAVTIVCSEKQMLEHDSKWTAEALFNILDNAVKYTPEKGEIHITVEYWEAYTKIDIVDNGKGIKEENQAAVFRRFYREEAVHDIEGVGIGLYLTREIITRQGGYIRLKSAVGQGSTFSVFLPNKSNTSRQATAYY